MRSVSKIPIPVELDAAGAGTALSPWPLSGFVSEVRLPAEASALTAGGTASFTLVRVGDGGTILAVTNQAAPWQYAPRQAEHTTAGGSVGADGGVGVDDYLRLTVAQGAPNTAGTVFVTVGAVGGV